MPVTRTSMTNTTSLDEIVAKLSRRSEIDGLIIVGSAARNELTETSDFDLIVVLSHMPHPLHVGVTYIDGRVTDLVFHSGDEVDEILAAGAPHELSDWTGRLALFNRFLHEQDRYEKFRLYEDLAAQTVAPIGPLWRNGETIMVLDAELITPQMENEALDFWDELVS